MLAWLSALLVIGFPTTNDAGYVVSRDTIRRDIVERGLLLTLFSVNRFRHRLENAAAVDAMTGLLNRQAFEFIFDQACSEMQCKQQSLSAILIDLLKLINDTYGHLAGGQAAVSVSMGVAQYLPQESLSSLFSRADAALYRAKAGGRNRVEAAAE